MPVLKEVWMDGDRRGRCSLWFTARSLTTMHISEYVLHVQNSCSWSHFLHQPPPHALILFCRKTCELSLLSSPLTPVRLCLPFSEPQPVYTAQSCCQCSLERPPRLTPITPPTQYSLGFLPPDQLLFSVAPRKTVFSSTSSHQRAQTQS